MIYGELKNAIKRKRFTAAVVGLGYVGMPTSLAIAKAGIKVIGVDISRARVREINAGKSFIADISDSEIKSVRKYFRATSDWNELKRAQVIIIAVPTPLTKHKTPDTSFIEAATKNIAKNFKKNALVILESTTYPGTTEEIVKPILEKSGCVAGKDFYLAFAPERIDPGNKQFKFTDVPKVVGGIDQRSTELATIFYQTFLKSVHKVSSSSAAEMTKLYENIFRLVNISLVNELKMVSDRMGIDFWEVIEAAKTKPYGFMPFYPGPGVGGHCIGIDPVYLSWKARHHGKAVQFIELARLINTQMPNYIVERAVYLLNERVKKGVFGSKILAVGVAYKANVSDVRESPAVEIIDRLKELGAHVAYHDPHVLEVRMGNFQLRSQPLNAKFLRQQDLVLFLTDHSKLNRSLIAKEAKLIFDVRNAFKSMKKRSNIVKL